MGELRPVYKAVLIAGITFSGDAYISETLSVVKEKIGEPVFESPVFDFIMTDYYEKEMGKNLLKAFYCFEKPIDMESLSDIKLISNEIEKGFCEKDDDVLNRRINIDPGYVTLSKLVLASTKDYSHRIYIGNGIYAETTLRFVRGSFIPIDTTYPDYKTDIAITFFNRCREYLKENRHIWNPENVSNI